MTKTTDNKRMESSELAEDLFAEHPPFQGSFSLPEKVSNAAC